MRPALALAALLLVAGCGGADHPEQEASPGRRSEAPMDAALKEAGVGTQLVQSLSETAQSAAYARDPDQLTSWRESQDLALLALRRCRAVAAGRATWDAYRRADVARGIPAPGAARVDRFMEQEFCTALRG